MNRNYYALYVADTFKLASTLCIKSLESADGMNNYLIALYGQTAVDLLSPATWKYYLNIAGEYHSTDTPMLITSLDTREIITFNKANLVTHTATKQAYSFGSRYYYNLLKSYPSQETLIMGILYPADLMTAVNAAEGTILAYDTNLVESHELTLLPDLEGWIKRFLIRWHVRGFGITDTLYPAAMHAVLYQNIVPKLLNLRLKRCRTVEAHSFHIREYLASHNALDRFLPYLTLRQALFLYRNIVYIDRNAGKQSMLIWLIERILTERAIPVFDYSMKHKGVFDANYHPEYVFRMRNMNTVANTPPKQYLSLAEVLTKEINDGLDTALYNDSNYTRIDTMFRNSPSNVVKTKVIESSVIDGAGSELYTITDIMFNHWGYMAAKGLYQTTVNFTDPTTGTLHSLSTEDAFIYVVYLYSKMLGNPLLVVPPYTVDRVINPVRPTLAALEGKLDNGIFADKTIASYLLNGLPTLGTKSSVSSFLALGKSIFDASNLQVRAIANQPDLFGRSQVSTIVNDFYIDTSLTFSKDGMTIADWMLGNGLIDFNYNAAEAQSIIDTVTTAATGYSIDPTTLIKNIQANMMGVMRTLCAYSTQFITTVNDYPIKSFNIPYIRAGDVTTQIDMLDQIDIAKPTLLGNDMVTNTTIFYDSNASIPAYAFVPLIKLAQSTVIPVKMISIEPLGLGPISRDTLNVNIGRFNLGVTLNGVVQPADPYRPGIGYTTLDSLTATQISQFQDVYNTVYNGLPTDPVQPLQNVVTVGTLDTFTYLSIPITNLSGL